MPSLHLHRCDICGSESKLDPEYTKLGWAYVGMYPKAPGPVTQFTICPKCSPKIKKWLKEQGAIA